MGLYVLEGIVLRRRSLGEADRLVTLFSRDRGKVTAVARGARRPRSRLGGRLEPPARVRALVAEGRTLDVLAQVEVLDAYPPLRRDLERMAATALVLELVDRALADRHPHPDVYRLLQDALGLLVQGAGDLACVWFLARLLVLTGYRPVVGRCAACGNRTRGEVAWSAILGGGLDASCQARDPQATPLDARAAALLAFLLDARPAAVRRLRPPARALAAAGRALRRTAEAAWEVRLRAPAVIGRLRETAPSYATARSGSGTP
ncbi:MAG: DNA repair protein RecO [Armatimonadota bacterium]|nr:DNA repair protein RecO [Armatimonadota bacterium]MDR7536569.1 DNA repair protein RecO [Armatimonadota bacterium]